MTDEEDPTEAQVREFERRLREERDVRSEETELARSYADLQAALRANAPAVEIEAVIARLRVVHREWLHNMAEVLGARGWYVAGRAHDCYHPCVSCHGEGGHLDEEGRPSAEMACRCPRCAELPRVELPIGN